MYADRRRAFENRIGELLQDHRNAYPRSRQVTNNQWRDVASRILSALEDAYHMGLGEFQQAHRRAIDTAPTEDPGEATMNDQGPSNG